MHDMCICIPDSYSVEALSSSADHLQRLSFFAYLVPGVRILGNIHSFS